MGLKSLFGHLFSRPTTTPTTEAVTAEPAEMRSCLYVVHKGMENNETGFELGLHSCCIVQAAALLVGPGRYSLCESRQFWFAVSKISSSGGSCEVALSVRNGDGRETKTTFSKAEAIALLEAWQERAPARGLAPKGTYRDVSCHFSRFTQETGMEMQGGQPQIQMLEASP